MTGEPGAWQRRSGDAIAAAAGLVVLTAGILVVRDGAVPAWERSTFEAVNGLPGWLYPVLWPFQQLGVVVWGPVLALAAAVARRYRLAWALVAVTVAKLVSERVVKAVVTRERPGTSIGPDAELRGDVHVAGESFVSGHAVMVAAIACLVVPYLPRRWRPLGWLLVVAVMVGRVYVGAHNPLDVVCGAALGVAIGSGLNLAFGVPAPAVATVRRDVSPSA
ncbi:MAG TPA: phosphatase PAP2 family protein [Acidimicrobiales bacterium]|nr:phosphatase PAP2 family protein [Acidimicrobiales bacterium]